MIDRMLHSRLFTVLLCTGICVGSIFAIKWKLDSEIASFREQSPVHSFVVDRVFGEEVGK